MKLSARNVFKGTVTSVESGPINAKVLVDIGAGHIVSSVVTADAITDLGLIEGAEVSVIIKSSSVMLAT